MYTSEKTISTIHLQTHILTCIYENEKKWNVLEAIHAFHLESLAKLNSNIELSKNTLSTKKCHINIWWSFSLSMNKKIVALKSRDNSKKQAEHHIHRFIYKRNIKTRTLVLSIFFELLYVCSKKLSKHSHEHVHTLSSKYRPKNQ